MNITFLIGNGFDIGVGLKTKFSDYFPIYCKDSEPEKKTSLRGLASVIDTNREEWAYYEKELGNYTVHFDTDTQQELIAQAKDFQNCFIEYLKTQEALVQYHDERLILDTMTNALVNYYLHGNLLAESEDRLVAKYNARASENHVYNFVTFNYTSVLQKCLNLFDDRVVQRRKNNAYVDKIGEVVHVHGKTNQFPITGVDGVDQIANENLRGNKQFVDYFVKPEINNRIRMSFDNKATRLIQNSDVICIYGMALGETDRKWWNMIVRWLAGNDARQLIVFDYDDKFTQANPFDLLEKEDTLYAKLSKFSNGNVNIDRLRKQIHMAIHKNIFEMPLAKQPEDGSSEGQKNVHSSVGRVDPNMIYYGNVPPEESGLLHKKGQLYYQRVSVPEK